MSERFRSYIIAVLGLGLVLGPAVWSGALAVSQYEERERAQTTQNADKRELEATRSLLLNPDEYAVSVERRERSDLDAQWLAANGSIAQSIIGVLGLIGLIATVHFARGAYLEAKRSADADNEALEYTKRQLDEARDASAAEQARMRKDAEIQEERFELQLAAAMAAAKAARDSADAASFIGRNQSRAYVHVAGADLDYTSHRTLLGGGFDPELYLTFENVGVTPTKSIRVAVAANIETFEQVWNGFRAIGHGQFSEIVNVAPNSKQRIHIYTLNLREAAEGDYDPGKNAFNLKKFVIRGRIIYRDVFGDEHFTDFGYSGFKPHPGELHELDPLTEGFARYERHPKDE